MTDKKLNEIVKDWLTDFNYYKFVSELDKSVEIRSFDVDEELDMAKWIAMKLNGKIGLSVYSFDEDSDSYIIFIAKSSIMKPLIYKLNTLLNVEDYSISIFGKPEVVCNSCGWEGLEEDLIMLTDLSDKEVGHDVEYNKACPNCKSIEDLVY